MAKFTIALVAFLLACLPACSREASASRSIRAHTHVVQGIAHANPAAQAERYCSACHGAALAGGEHYEPSCFQCHGKNWLQDPAAAQISPAPADHTVLKQGSSLAGPVAAAGFLHKSTLFTPVGDCTACHGSALEGTQAYPSCTLCHTALWTERQSPP